MSKLQAWLLAARPNTLWAAAAPVLVGTACAAHYSAVRPIPALLALLGGLLIQVGTNYANDYFDFVQGADTKARVGPTRAVQAGLLTAQEMLAGTIVVFAVAFLVGLGLVAYGGWPILVLGIASIVSGVIYTGGPFPLAYNGLGDVFVMLFFGFGAVCGTVYVQMLAVPILAVWASLGVGALSTAILVVNNIRDEQTDADAGKNTLVVRYGRQFGQREYQRLLALAYVVPVVMVAFGAPFLVLTTWLTLPNAFRLADFVEQTRGRALNEGLKSTAILLLIYSLLLSIGLAV